LAAATASAALGVDLPGQREREGSGPTVVARGEVRGGVTGLWSSSSGGVAS